MFGQNVHNELSVNNLYKYQKTVEKKPINEVLQAPFVSKKVQKQLNNTKSHKKKLKTIGIDTNLVKDSIVGEKLKITEFLKKN